VSREGLHDYMRPRARGCSYIPVPFLMRTWSFLRRGDCYAGQACSIRYLSTDRDHCWVFQ
jgi:hypothetical protein